MARQTGLGLAYKAHLVERGLAAASVNRKLAAVRSLSKLERILRSRVRPLARHRESVERLRETRGARAAKP